MRMEHYPYYIGLQLCLFFSGLGLDSFVDIFRNWTPKQDLERCVSTIMKTRFVALEVPFPGAALDIDNDKDYEVICGMFQEWWDYLHQEEPSLPLQSQLSM